MGEFYSSKDTKTAQPSNVRIWQILCIVFAIIALALLIALIVVATSSDDEEVETCPSSSAKVSAQTSSPGKAAIFNDLTSDELKAVRDYMLKKTSYKIKKFSEATVNSNHIYLIELYAPKKDEALSYLDGNKGKPTRKARVVVFVGEDSTPKVEEYLVYPADKPTKDEKLTYKALNGGYIPFSSRPSNSIENKAIDELLKKELKKMENILKARYNGFYYTGCKEKCLWYAVASPRHTNTDNERKAWVFFRYGLPGKIMHPIDFELYIDLSGADTTKWKIEKVAIENKVEYSDIDSLVKFYTSDKKYPLPEYWDNNEKLFSSLYPKGSPPVYFTSVEEGPQIYEPAGNRFKIEGRHVEYMDWDFDIRHKSSTGMQIFNINYRKERIIYELSLQEAASTYSSNSGALSTAKFLDSSYGLGASHHEMVRGYDCPGTAAFLDTVILFDSEEPQVKKNAICIFEWNTGTPLRRHFEQNTGDGKTYYGAMQNQVLVIRSIGTVYNYDYMFDYIFYQNGMVEVKVSSTGYVLTAYYTNDEKEYSYEVQDDVAAPVHDHYVNYKVDLDIYGRNNTVEKLEVKTTTVSDWLSRSVVRKQLKPSTVKTEFDTRIKLEDLFKPMYINVMNNNKANGMGLKRGYRIQLGNPVLQGYQTTDTDFNKMISWANYPIAATMYKDNERTSSSIYNQNSGGDPVVNFQSYLDDNEDIENKDVVNWVTLRLLHIPTSEDIPMTVTNPNYVHFFIRPFNYFNQDPSINSRNVILMKPGKIEEYTKEHDACVPEKPETGYSGF